MKRGRARDCCTKVMLAPSSLFFSSSLPRQKNKKTKNHAPPPPFLSAGPRPPATHPARRASGARRHDALRLFDGSRRRGSRRVQAAAAAADAAVRLLFLSLWCCHCRCCWRWGPRKGRSSGWWGHGARWRHERSAGLFRGLFFSFLSSFVASFFPLVSTSTSLSQPLGLSASKKNPSLLSQGKAKGWSPTTGAYTAPATEGGGTK